MKINLLPKEYRPQPAVSFPRLLFVIVFIVSIFGTGLFLTTEYFTLNKIDSEIEKVDEDLNLYGQQYQSVKMIEDEQAEITKKKKEIDTIMQSYIPVNEYLGEIIAPLPEKVWLKSLKMDGDKITVQGNSDRMRAVAMYMMDIESSPVFQGTSLSTINNANNKGVGDIFDFQLTFQAVKAGLKQ